uniref:diisopropyl-fluorophosphatase n=1 Tax=Ciona intestinalis TaxID=7719 RepID=UPI000180B9A5|nr:diisopropyl-fluorophosphatase [Ciona intestinalis]|eukprot:XP_002130142.1 diisopropyl-fluorophosphatase [Ciona intestinalis]
MAKTIEPKFKMVTKDIDGSEGPVFDTKGRFYAVAPMESADDNRETGQFLDGIAGKLYSVNLNTGEKQVVCTPQFNGYGGRPAGCQSDKEDNIWIADMRLGLLKYDGKGNCKQFSVVDTDGNPLNGANDLVFDDDGNLWFTGPGSPVAPSVEDRTTIFAEPTGRIYCLPKGSEVPIKVDDNFRFCNGIAVTGKLLLVAETMTKQIIAYDVTGPGNVTNRRIWSKVPKGAEQGGPDGMDFDERGCLLVANHGGSHIEVYPPEGGDEPIIRVRCPFKTPSNVHFAQNSNVCYVTEHDTNGVWAFEWDCKGALMYCDK